MKSLWHSVSLFVTVVITFVIASSSYEGSDLPDDQVEQVLALYNRHCRSSYGLSTSPGHNVHVVCKEGREDYGPPKTNVIKIPPGPPQKKNILFVEAPAYNVKHEITVVGEPAKAPRTVVYVLPNKNHHNFNFLYRNGHQEVPKPQVFFLGSKSQGGIGSSPPYGGYPSGPVEVPSGNYGTTSTSSVATVSQPISNHNPSGGYPSVISVPQNDYQQISSQQPIQPSSEYQTTVTSVPSTSTTSDSYSNQPSSQVLVSEAQPDQRQPAPPQQGGRNEELSLPGLGPEYELVPADPDTLSQYEKYFNHIKSGYSTALNDRMKQSRSIATGNFPFAVRNTEVEQMDDKEAEIAFKPLSQSGIPSEGVREEISSVAPTDERRSRIIFPDESIQQFQYSSVEATEEPRPTTEEPVTRKSIINLQQRSLFKRKSHVSKIRFPGEPFSPEKYLLSYNDYYNYMGSPGSQEEVSSSSSSSKEGNTSKKGRRKRVRSKSRSSSKVESSQQKYSSEEKTVEIKDRIESIASANLDLKSNRRQSSSPFHAKLLLAFASQAEMESTSPAPSHSHFRTIYTTARSTTTTPSPSLFSDNLRSTYTVVDNLSITGNSRNRKRSHPPAFEMIPAPLVSYSYTKVAK